MEIKVGMADLNVCESPDSIITLGLGSCVGAVLYDPVSKKCGMVHVMLPDSTTIANNQNISISKEKIIIIQTYLKDIK